MIICTSWNGSYHCVTMNKMLGMLVTIQPQTLHIIGQKPDIYYFLLCKSMYQSSLSRYLTLSLRKNKSF